MIKIATIFLHDTGKLTTSSSTSESGAGNIANNGTEFPLKIRTIKFDAGETFDNSPSPGSSEMPKLAHVSLVAPIITITGQINRKADVSDSSAVINKISGGTPTITDESGSSSTDEVKMLGLLEHARRTKGYKELYYKSTDVDNLFAGIATDTETSGTYNCFYVRVKSISITETPDSDLIIWNTTLEMTT